MQDPIAIKIQHLGEMPQVIDRGVVWDRMGSYATATTGAFSWQNAPNWDEPVEKETFPDGTFCYRLKGEFHCPFAPAVPYKDGTPLWFIEGRMLLDAEVSIVKSILEDISLAPLYINDSIYKYPSKWVLKGTK